MKKSEKKISKKSNFSSLDILSYFLGFSIGIGSIVLFVVYIFFVIFTNNPYPDSYSFALMCQISYPFSFIAGLFKTLDFMRKIYS